MRTEDRIFYRLQLLDELRQRRRALEFPGTAQTDAIRERLIRLDELISEIEEAGLDNGGATGT